MKVELSQSRGLCHWARVPGVGVDLQLWIEEIFGADIPSDEKCEKYLHLEKLYFLVPCEAFEGMDDFHPTWTLRSTTGPHSGL